MINIKKVILAVSSFIGAAGIALQNYLGASALIQELMGAAFALTEAGKGISHSLGAAFGGICSGFINFLINWQLLENFFRRMERLRERKGRPVLSGWKRVLCWVGTVIFIISGLLYGLTAVAFSPSGVMAVLGLIAGVMVTPFTTIQELEVWLDTHDPLDPDTGVRQSKSLKSKIAGNILAAGTVISLSLLFTLGLAAFLIGAGVAALPALIAGFAVAFTVGAFTEYYFYSPYLTKFCNNIKADWAAFKRSDYAVLGGICVGINGVVNGILSYVGITLLFGLLLTAGVMAPPLGVIIAVAVVTALFATAASLILGTKFWSEQFRKKSAVIAIDNENDALLSDQPILKALRPAQPAAPAPTRRLSDSSLPATTATPAQSTPGIRRSLSSHSLFNTTKPTEPTANPSSAQGIVFAL